VPSSASTSNTPPVSPSMAQSRTCLLPSRLSSYNSSKDRRNGPHRRRWYCKRWNRLGQARSARSRRKRPLLLLKTLCTVVSLIGREAELKQLQSAVRRRRVWAGALMMVLGEPGIGKTALCEQLATYVNPEGRTYPGRPLLRGRVSITGLTLPLSRRCGHTFWTGSRMTCKRELGSGAYRCSQNRLRRYARSWT